MIYEIARIRDGVPVDSRHVSATRRADAEAAAERFAAGLRRSQASGSLVVLYARQNRFTLKARPVAAFRKRYRASRGAPSAPPVVEKV